jgi:exosortase
MLLKTSDPQQLASRSPVGVQLSLFFIIALAAFIVPTMFDVARESWSTEQGAHGPLVLATGLWLIARRWPSMRELAKPGRLSLSAALLAPILILFTLARITSIIEVEGFALYAALILVAYACFGWASLRQIAFPLVYLLFVFPPPDTLFAALTQPLKIAISQWSVDILHALGYPIAASGVTIQLGQYQMLVAAACAGLNSLLSLTALGLFYCYIKHRSNWRYMLFMLCAIVPIAIAANLVRVLLLLLITYHFGEAAGQGFFHDLAGMTMFTVALLGIFALDWIATPLRKRWAKDGAAA